MGPARGNRPCHTERQGQGVWEILQWRSNVYCYDIPMFANLLDNFISCVEKDKIDRFRHLNSLCNRSLYRSKFDFDFLSNYAI